MLEKLLNARSDAPASGGFDGNNATVADIMLSGSSVELVAGE